MTEMLVRPDSVAMPIGTALKNVAKLNDLPPFVRLYQSGRKAVVVVHRKYSDQWRAALGAQAFVADTDNDGLTLWTSELFWFGACVQLVYGGRDA